MTADTSTVWCVRSMGSWRNCTIVSSVLLPFDVVSVMYVGLALVCTFTWLYVWLFVRACVRHVCMLRSACAGSARPLSKQIRHLTSRLVQTKQTPDTYDAGNMNCSVRHPKPQKRSMQMWSNQRGPMYQPGIVHAQRVVIKQQLGTTNGNEQQHN